MTNKDTGGPAFPSKKKVYRAGYATDEYVPVDGMTLRDYFAAKAMQIMWDAYDKGYCGLNNQDAPNVEVIARASYSMADAMLEARK